MDFIRSDLLYLSVDAMFACLLFLCISARKGGLLLVAIFASLALALKLILFIGLRPFEAGNDTLAYYHTFQLLDELSTAREIGGTYGGTEKSGELLYWPFAALIKSIIGDNFRFYLIISALISGYLTYLGNKKLISEHPLQKGKKDLSIAIICTYLVFLSLEIAYFGGHIRSALGVPLALISYCLALQRNIIASIVVLFFAIGFHNSAISILPLLLIEVLAPQFKPSRKATLFIGSSLVAAFLFGKLNGIGSLMNAIGGYYSSRYTDYVEYEGFNIQSIFSTAYFWIILIYLIIFLIIGYKRVHFYAFYYFGLILAFASTPKISERFFAYILICLPLLLYQSLRTRMSDNSSLLITSALSVALSPLVVTSYAVTTSLSIQSYIYPR